MPTPDQRSVSALVLTHNAPRALDRCLRAICGQTVPPDSIIIVDNASEPEVLSESLPEGLPPTRIVRSEVNTGPAGGWARAFREFLDDSGDLAWVMDDDAVADAVCLEFLKRRSAALGERSVMFPRWIQPDGSDPGWGAWCGFLISRQAIETVGVPMEEFFWWGEDTEYTQIRLPAAGYPRVRVEKAIVHHCPARHSSNTPTWKYYYEARNMTYLHLYVAKRVGRYPRSLSLLIGKALIREREDRARKLVALGRGLFDGVFKRLGVRFPVTGLAETVQSR
jgi:rhamnopyranosyl-N-acetylglucosaminyl-diphospho-decaprenol beta-1,3/1,4-galactofuranosyltransferase